MMPAPQETKENSMKTKSILEALDLSDSNPGACTGPDSWLSTKDSAELVSINPNTGEALGKVRMATASDSKSETAGSALARLTQTFAAAGIDSASLDARLLKAPNIYGP